MISIRKHILFVCTGNTCRSPFAEYIMRKIIEDRYGEKVEDIKASSAGTYAVSGIEPPADALLAAEDFGVDMAPHRSRSIHLSMMEAADAVFCMTARHKAFLVARFPWFEDKIFILKKYAEGKYTGEDSDTVDERYDIPDPIGQGAQMYHKVFQEIMLSVEKIIENFETEKSFRKKLSCTYNIAIASDHAGYKLKKEIGDFLKKMGHHVNDFGTKSKGESVDYPDFGKPAAESVSKGENDYGVLICGTGVGMCIVANKVKGVRAALVSDVITARLSKAHDDANVLCLGERITTPMIAKEIVQSWISTPFTGGRHSRRVKKIEPST